MQDGAGPRPFDVTTRHLIEGDPAGWLSWVGLTVNGPVHPIESDVSTVLADVDKVLRVDAPSPWLAHLEVQSGRDPRLPSRLLQYHALLQYRYGLPIESTIVLLRPEADGPELSGRLDRHGATNNLTISFWFRVVRLWERPVDELLHGGLGILPLAPLAAVEHDRLPSIIRQIDDRLTREAPPDSVGDLWAAILLLLGLRYDEDEARQLLQGVKGMRESSTYQAILEEGREEGREEGQLVEARRIVRVLGTEKFGEPDALAVSVLERVSDLETLHHLARGVLSASSWQELLATIPDH